MTDEQIAIICALILLVFGSVVLLMRNGGKR